MSAGNAGIRKIGKESTSAHHLIANVKSVMDSSKYCHPHMQSYTGDKCNICAQLERESLEIFEGNLIKSRLFRDKVSEIVDNKVKEYKYNNSTEDVDQQRIQEIKERVASASIGIWTCVPRDAKFHPHLGGKPINHESAIKYGNEHNLGCEVSGLYEPSRGTFGVADGWMIANSKSDILFLIKKINELKKRIKNITLKVGSENDK